MPSIPDSRSNNPQDSRIRITSHRVTSYLIRHVKSSSYELVGFGRFVFRLTGHSIRQGLSAKIDFKSYVEPSHVVNPMHTFY